MSKITNDSLAQDAYSCTLIATVSVKGLTTVLGQCCHDCVEAQLSLTNPRHAPASVARFI